MSEDVTMDGAPVSLGGETVEEGDEAPGFRVLADLGDERVFDAVENEGRVHILTTALSVDTPVCATQFQEFEERAEGLADEGIEVWYITRDLPFALQRFAKETGADDIEFFSDYKEEEFGEKFGVAVDEFGLLTRATFVIGPDGRVVYREVCSEIGDEPDYDAAVEAARAAKRTE